MLRLKELRESKKMSQRRLAMELNLAQTSISKYELGQAEPDIQTILRIADYFHVSTDYLLGKDAPRQYGQSELERDCLFRFNRLTQAQKQLALAYMKGLLQE